MTRDSDFWCRHYSGVGNGPVCKAGILYETVEDNSGKNRRRHPCYDREAVTVCEKYKPYTADELAAQEKELENFLVKMADFSARKTDICFRCGKKVTSLRQVGRCVYTSCGCRLWQGKVPEAWK